MGGKSGLVTTTAARAGLPRWVKTARAVRHRNKRDVFMGNAIGLMIGMTTDSLRPFATRPFFRKRWQYFVFLIQCQSFYRLFSQKCEPSPQDSRSSLLSPGKAVEGRKKAQKAQARPLGDSCLSSIRVSILPTAPSRSNPQFLRLLRLFAAIPIPVFGLLPFVFPPPTPSPTKKPRQTSGGAMRVRGCCPLDRLGDRVSGNCACRHGSAAACKQEQTGCRAGSGGGFGHGAYQADVETNAILPDVVHPQGQRTH